MPSLGHFLDKTVEIAWDLKTCQILRLVRVGHYYNPLSIITKMLFSFFSVPLLDCDWNRSLLCNHFLHWPKGTEKECKKIQCDIYEFYDESVKAKKIPSIVLTQILLSYLRYFVRLLLLER